MSDDMAPAFEVAIAGRDLPTGLTQFINRIVVETADGVAGMAKMTLTDSAEALAREGAGLLVDSRLVAEGNEVDVWMGYGPVLVHQGRFVVSRVAPIFPEDEPPSVEVTAYTKDYLMMDNEPEEGKNRVFPDARIDDAVFDVSGRYGFVTDIDEVPDVPWARVQKAGLKDYEFVKGLANLVGFLFWVDGDDQGTWTLHFRDPDTVVSGGVTGIVVQEKKFRFTYGFDDDSALLSFEPESAVRGARTKLKVQVKNPITGAIHEAEIEEDLQAPDLQFTGEARDTVGEPVPTGGSVRLFFDEFSFDIVPTKKFASDDDTVAWAQQWFRRNRENFVLARGRLIGVETLRARQIHTIDGVGKRFSGDYQFTRVQHIMDGDSGYTIDFNARKVIG